MKLNNLRDNSIYAIIFSSFFRLTAILIFALLLISYIIISYTTIHMRSLQAVSQTETICNNITYIMQDDIIMSNSLATNDTIIKNIDSFTAQTAQRKIDIDNELTRLFESYYASGEIDAIRVFLPLSDKPDVIGFKSVAYLDTFSDEAWLKYFTVGTSAISAEYSCDTNYNSYFYKNPECLSIIVPIMANKTDCYGFLCVDIDKNKLVSRVCGKTDELAPYLFIADNGGNVINAANPGFDIDKDILYSASSGYTTAKYNGRKYLQTYSTTNRHGWKVIQFFPQSVISSLTLPILLIFLSLMTVFLIIAILYSRRKSAVLAQPLQVLSEAMEESAKVDASGDMASELESVYVAYNNLLDKNNALLSEMEKNIEKQKKSETKMLLAQISPHFLYNTLNSIAWKAVNANQPDICAVVSKLAKLFKMSYSFTSEFTTFSQELAHIQLYIELQKECFGNRFDYNISIPDAYSDFEVPRFILQPLVENSIIHGFSQLNSDRHGMISITASADETLVITISDNGIGIDKEILINLNSDNYFSEKYGIHNINQRIKLLCGKEYGLRFQSNGHSKTSAVITLPIKIVPKEA